MMKKQKPIQISTQRNPFLKLETEIYLLIKIPMLQVCIPQRKKANWNLK